MFVAWDDMLDVVADSENAHDLYQHFSGNLNVRIGTERDWLKAVRAQPRSRMMSANPPRRNSSFTVHF
jgi:hypothetical protein